MAKEQSKHWFGSPPIEVHPLKPYQVTHTEALRRGGDRGLAAYLGSVVERTSISIWNHPEIAKCIDSKTVTSAVEEIRTGLAEKIGTKRLKTAAELSKSYEDIQHSESVGSLFDVVQKAIVVLGHKDRLEAWKGLTDPNHQRFVVETALIIAKEMLTPSFKLQEGSVIVPSLCVGKRNKIFDGVVVPIHDFVPELSFEDIQTRKIPWDIIETKAVFSVWRTTGRNPLEKAPQAFTKRLKNQLCFAEEWVKKNLPGVDFNYPDSVELFCFRGVKPSMVFRESGVKEHLHYA